MMEIVMFSQSISISQILAVEIYMATTLSFEGPV